MNKLYATIAMLICTASLFGQIITSEEVKERAEQKSEQRVDQKVDEGIDKGLDAIEGLLFGKRKKNKGDQEANQTQNIGSASSGSAASAGAMGGMMSQQPADVRELYAFDAYTVVKMEITDKRGKVDELIFRYYFPEDGAYIGTELQSATGTKDMPKSITIMDLTNQQMVMLMDNPGQQPMGMVMQLDADAIETLDDMQEDEPAPDVQLTKTGRTKKILGYNCEEYTMNLEDGTTGSYWVTDETDLNIGGALTAMGMQDKQNGKRKNNMNLPDNYPAGAVMEMDFTQENGEKMTMTTIEINTNYQRFYNTSGYTFMNMNFGR